MKLYLLRHAQAEDGTPDFERPLSEEGRKRSRLVARYLTPWLAGARVVTSPAPRALQTAEILHREAGLTTPLEREPSFYAGQARAVAGWLAPRSDSVLVLVGHEPVWSELGAHLVGGGYLELKKGGVIRVDLRHGQGTLRWLLDPRVLERA